MKNKIRIGMVGATGYVGSEMLSQLCKHPGVEITRLASQSYSGRLYSDVYPSFKRVLDLALADPDSDNWAADCDLVITALPHGVSQVTVPRLLDEGLKVIDHSGDFRFREAADYEAAYKLTAIRPDLLQEAVYGIPELYREELKIARLVANPGCYPTASILAFAPILDAQALEPGPIVINALSGISGAGRQSSVEYGYCEAADSVRPYAVLGHRHVPEIRQEMGLIAGQAVSLVFTPQLVPMKRGMLVSGFAGAKNSDWTQAKLTDLYKSYYQNDYFVRVLDEGQMVDTKQVTASNFIDIAPVWDESNACFKLFSAIDNLGKGAAMQAIQSMNLMFGFPEETGLDHPASFL